MLTTKLIGNRITEARKKMNVSQAQLAEQLFISSQAVGKWERGESMPDIITLNRLAAILGVDLNYFSGNTAVISTTATEDSSGNYSEVAEQPSFEALHDTSKRKMNWDMSRGNWIDADFSGLSDLNEKFSSSNMQRCKFNGSDLSGLLLSGNNISECDFTDSIINNSHVRRSNLEKNRLNNASLHATEFSGSNISACDFTDADFTGATLKSGGFEKNTIVNTVWKQTTFNGMYIVDVVFDGVIEDCYFESCTFKRATFQNATLTNTFFKNNNLKRVKFIDCKADRITYEFLKHGKADLNGITLLEA